MQGVGTIKPVAWPRTQHILAEFRAAIEAVLGPNLSGISLWRCPYSNNRR